MFVCFLFPVEHSFEIEKRKRKKEGENNLLFENMNVDMLGIF